jgi:phosphoglycerate dehydrogenase-like enzyme
MKILFCGKTFSNAPPMLKELLPGDEIFAAADPDVRRRGLAVDVIIPLMHRLEPDLIQGTSAHLIQQWGVGLEGVDIPAATARGILVCNVPADRTANADSTAEHAIFLMLGVSRRIHECLRAFNAGAWGSPLGEALCGKTVLIVGLGKVGRALASKLKGLGMEVQAIKKSPDPEAERELGLSALGSPADLLKMASKADFVVSTTLLTEETRGVCDRKLFENMKPEACIINVSRGPVINEPDLIEALERGTIAAAGLDVFTQEPLEPSSPLLSMSNVLATPHVAGVTRQTYQGIASVVVDNIQRVKAGKTPHYCVNADDVG